MKKILFALLILIQAAPAFTQQVEDYDAVITRLQRYYNEHHADSVYYVMFSDSLKKKMPLNKVASKLNQTYAGYGDMVSFQIMYQKEGQTFYTTTFQKNSLTLMMSMDRFYKLLSMRFVPYQDDSALQKRSSFFFTSPTGNLYGTLTAPSNVRKVPVVLIIPGAGPTDRDGNNAYGLNANTYSMIADSLLKEGYACLRYDKRGVSSSVAALPYEDELNFDTLVNDALGFVKLLKKHWHFSKVIILGHGEGSLIGMRVAQLEKVDGFISVSGLAQRGDKVIGNKLKTISKQMSKKARPVLDSLVNGYTINVTDSALSSMISNDEQTYLRSWLKYTPTDEIKKLKIPMLLIQGTNDLDVTEKETAKLHKANSGSQPAIIEGMNYIMKQATDDKQQNISTYTNPALPLCPGLMPAVLTFIREIK